jgi:hypothetical protein
LCAAATLEKKRGIEASKYLILQVRNGNVQVRRWGVIPPERGPRRIGAKRFRLRRAAKKQGSTSIDSGPGAGPIPKRKAAGEGGFFLFLPYKFRIPSSDGFTARI